MKDYLNFLLHNKTDLLKYLKSRLPMFHNSNLFFRDIHYGIKSFLEMKRKRITYGDSEKLAVEVISVLEKENLLKKVNKLGYLVNYPDFKTTKKEKQAA